MSVQVSTIGSNSGRVVYQQKPLRYEIVIEYRDHNGYTSASHHWSETKNKAFLQAARQCGSYYAQKCTVLTVQIWDGRTKKDVHKPGDDLYWLY